MTWRRYLSLVSGDSRTTRLKPAIKSPGPLTVICKKALTKWTPILKGKAVTGRAGKTVPARRAAKPLPKRMRKQPKPAPSRLGSVEYCARFLHPIANHHLDFEANSIIL